MRTDLPWSFYLSREKPCDGLGDDINILFEKRLSMRRRRGGCKTNQIFADPLFGRLHPNLDARREATV